MNQDGKPTLIGEGDVPVLFSPAVVVLTPLGLRRSQFRDKFFLRLVICLGYFI